MMKHKRRSTYLKQPIKASSPKPLHLVITEAAELAKLAAKGFFYFAPLIFTSSWNGESRQSYRPSLCRSGSLWCPHSEADTATRLFGAVKVDSFAQGFLQHKEETNEYLEAANPNQERQTDFLRVWESLGSFYLKFRSLSFMVKIITLGGSLLIFSLHI